jgi:integration host factor subunit beta
MIKSELVRRITERNPHLYTKMVERAVTSFFDEISAALVRGDRVEMRGFGSFSVNTWSARPGRNPRTGAVVSVPDRRHPLFKAGKEMRDRLNGTEGNDLRAAFHKPIDIAEPAEPQV